MKLLGLAGPAEQASNQVANGGRETIDESGSWPTKSEIEPGFDSIAPLPHAATDFFSTDDFELTLGGGGSDRYDTIPSPPPELESAPGQDER
jgi:hypothetical protein